MIRNAMMDYFTAIINVNGVVINRQIAISVNWIMEMFSNVFLATQDLL